MSVAIVGIGDLTLTSERDFAFVPINIHTAVLTWPFACLEQLVAIQKQRTEGFAK